MQVCSRITSKVYIVTDGELKHNKQQQLEDGTSRLGGESWRTCVYIIGFHQKTAGSDMHDMDSSI